MNFDINQERKELTFIIIRAQECPQRGIFMVLFEVDTYQNENCMVDHLNLTTKNTLIVSP